MEDGTFSGDPFVTIEEKAEGNDLKLSLKFNELFGQDLSLRTPNNIRRTYRNFMGNHELVGVSEDLGLTIRKNIVLRPYEDFHTHDEMLASIEKVGKKLKMIVWSKSKRLARARKDEMSNWESLAPIKRASMTTSIQPIKKPSQNLPKCWLP